MQSFTEFLSEQTQKTAQTQPQPETDHFRVKVIFKRPNKKGTVNVMVNFDNYPPGPFGSRDPVMYAVDLAKERRPDLLLHGYQVYGVDMS